MNTIIALIKKHALTAFWIWTSTILNPMAFLYIAVATGNNVNNVFLRSGAILFEGGCTTLVIVGMWWAYTHKKLTTNNRYDLTHGAGIVVSVLLVGTDCLHVHPNYSLFLAVPTMITSLVVIPFVQMGFMRRERARLELLKKEEEEKLNSCLEIIGKEVITRKAKTADEILFVKVCFGSAQKSETTLKEIQEQKSALDIGDTHP